MGLQGAESPALHGSVKNLVSMKASHDPFYVTPCLIIWN
jgi:hypothetical protein